MGLEPLGGLSEMLQLRAHIHGECRQAQPPGCHKPFSVLSELSVQLSSFSPDICLVCLVPGNRLWVRDDFQLQIGEAACVHSLPAPQSVGDVGMATAG